MKKFVLAGIIVLTSTTAFAQNSVEVYGKMRIYQESYKAGTASSITQQSNDASRIGFKGIEDLGNGIKANFTIETGFGADSPSTTTLGDRQSTIGLSGSVGSLDLGRAKHSLGRTFDKFDTFGNSTFSSVGAIHSSQGTRISNGLFLTVKPSKNTSIDYQYGNSEVAGTPSIQSGAVNFNLGSISATVARYDNGQTSASDVYATSYDIKATGTKIAAIYSNDEVSGVKTKGKSLGIAQKIAGPISVIARYGKNENIKAYNAGFNYSLSKRTTILARYIEQDAVNDTNDLQRVALGIEHNF